MAGVDDRAAAAERPAPSASDVVALLRERFGDLYEESYDRGKRQFVDAVSERFGVDGVVAADLIEALEKAQTIRYQRETTGRDVPGPRVGLFDEPGPRPAERPDPGPMGRHWQIGREESDLPGII